MSGVRVTQAFIDVAQPATEILRKATRAKVPHSWSMADWHGDGTMELSIFPPSKESYLKHKESYDKFWDTLRAAGFLKSDPYEDIVSVVKRGRGFCLTAIIKNLEHYETEE